jgi:hypothetical protein
MRAMVRAALFTIFALFALSGCARKISDIPEPSEVSVQVSQEMEKAFAEGREARVWLATPGNVLFEMGNETGREWTEKLYAAGADVVKVCDADKIDEGSAGEISATLAIGIPGDSAKRKTLFVVLNELEEATDHETSKDVGQRFEMVNVD